MSPFAGLLDAAEILKKRIEDLESENKHRMSDYLSECAKVAGLQDKLRATIEVLREIQEECDHEIDIDEHGGPNLAMKVDRLAGDALAKIEVWAPMERGKCPLTVELTPEQTAELNAARDFVRGEEAAK